MTAVQSPSRGTGRIGDGHEGAVDARTMSSAWYRALFDHSLNGIPLIDPASGAVLAANPEACRLLGYTEAELCALDRTALVDATDPRLAAATAERARTGTFRGELTYRRADGTLFPVEVANSLFTGPDGRLVAEAFFTDISDRKQAEATLCESAAKFATTFAANPAAICITRQADGLYLDANPAYQQLTGYSFAELIGHSSVELGIVSPAYRAELAVLLGQQGRVHDFEARIVTKSGALVEVLTAIEPIEVAGVPCFLLMTIDITERKAAERNRAFLAAIVDTTADAIIAIDLDLTITAWNRSAELLTGFTAAEVVGHSLPTLPFAPAFEPLAAAIQALRRGEPVPAYETTRLTKDGRTAIARVSLAAIRDAAGELLGISAIAHDVTERTQMENVLRQSEAKFARLFQSSPAGVAVSAMGSGRFVDVNAAYLALTGYSREELIGRTFVALGLFTPATLAAIAAQMQQGASPRNVEIDLTTKAGATRHCLFSSDIVDLPVGQCIQTSIVDITARKEAERNRAFLAAIVESSGDAIISLDTDLQITSWNQAAAQLTGYAAAEVIGQSIRGVTPPDYPELLAEQLAAMQREATIPSFEAARVRRDGQPITMLISNAPIRNYAGEVMGIASIAHDITERKRAEAELRESERKYRDLYDHSPDMYLSGYPADHVIRDCNLTLAHTLGYTKEELIGQPNCVIFTPEGFAHMVAALPQYAAAGHYENFEIQLRHKDGAVLDALMSGTLEPDPAGGPATSRVTLHDITVRKQMEKRLVASEARMRAVIENTSDRIWSVDREYRLLFANRALHRDMMAQAGYELPLNESVLDGPYMAGLRAVWQPLYDRAFAGEAFSVELVSAFRAGGMIETFLNPIRDEKGEVTGATARTVDITDRLQAELMTREALQRLRLAKGAADIGVWAWNFADESLEWDDHVYMFYGVSPAEGRPIHDIWRSRVHPDDRSLNDTTLAAARRTGQDWDSTFRIVLPDGRLRYIYSAAVVERNRKGEPVRMIGINRDVTQQKQYERLLQDANAVLEEQVAARTGELQATVAELARANVAKDAFMAAISHELRTPLTGILGIGDVLQSQIRGPLNPHQERYVQLILNSGRRLLDTVTSVLDYTSLLAGQVTIQPEPCQVAELCAVCIRAVHTAAQGKQLAVELDAPSDLVLMSDGQAITKILTTLLDNAIKFTPAQGRLGLEADRTTGPDAVRITVWDTGIGIHEEQVAHLFEPFVQGDQTLARRFEGLGLGLAYVHKLVELLGGSITVTSELGKGSRFQVTLPGT